MRYLIKWHRWQQLLSILIILNFPEDPGFPLNHRSTHHKVISPGVVEHYSDFMRINNIPIRNNWYGNILLNCPNAIVLRVAIEQASINLTITIHNLLYYRLRLVG